MPFHIKLFDCKKIHFTAFAIIKTMEKSPWKFHGWRAITNNKTGITNLPTICNSMMSFLIHKILILANSVDRGQVADALKDSHVI